MSRAARQKREREREKEQMSPAERRRKLEAHSHTLVAVALAAQATTETPRPKDPKANRSKKEEAPAKDHKGLKAHSDTLVLQKPSEEGPKNTTNSQLELRTPPHSTMSVLTRFTLGAQAPSRKHKTRPYPEPSPRAQRSGKTDKVDKAGAATATAPPQTAAVEPCISAVDSKCKWVNKRLMSCMKKPPSEAQQVSAFDSELPIVVRLSDQNASVIARAYYLLNLSDAVGNSCWNKEGTGFFWRPITPSHIRKLRATLQAGLTLIVTAFQTEGTEGSRQFATEINNLFQGVAKIIEEAQAKKPRYRSSAVKKLYQDTATAIQEIKGCNYEITQFPLSDRSSDPSFSPRR